MGSWAQVVAFGGPGVAVRDWGSKLEGVGRRGEERGVLLQVPGG